MEEVYAGSSKVLLDAAGSGNMIYLPVDKLLEGRRGSGISPAGRGAADAASSAANAAAARRQADELRTRRSR
jgi:membrane protease subunit HflK